MTMPSVVLLHGFTATPRVWDLVVDDLSRDHDVRALPIAGHRGGKPVVRGEVLPIEYFVDDVESHPVWADIDPAHIVGNSMGAWIALELAARGRARSVYALCPAGFWKGADDPVNADIRKVFTRADTDARRTRHIASLALRVPQVRRISFRQVAQHADRLTHAAAVEAVTGVRECTAFPGLSTACVPAQGTSTRLTVRWPCGWASTIGSSHPQPSVPRFGAGSRKRS